MASDTGMSTCDSAETTVTESVSVGSGGNTGVLWAHKGQSIAMAWVGSASPLCTMTFMTPMLLHTTSMLRGCATEAITDTATNNTYHASTSRATQCFDAVKVNTDWSQCDVRRSIFVHLAIAMLHGRCCG